MAANAVTPQDQPGSRLIAPEWHTFLVLLVMIALSALSAYSRSLSPITRAHGRLGGYASVMVSEWLIVAFIWFGVKRRGVRLQDLAGGRWPNSISVLRDLGIAVAYLIVSNIILGAIGRLLKAAPNQAVLDILPQGAAEVGLYLLLALTAGICEELIFRGYLQRQFAALTRSTAAGLVLQGVVFGAAHGYQGLKFMAIIAVYGCLFGLLAYWRSSLRPGMIAHFLQDGIIGLLARRFMQ